MNSAFRGPRYKHDILIHYNNKNPRRNASCFLFILAYLLIDKPSSTGFRHCHGKVTGKHFLHCRGVVRAFDFGQGNLSFLKSVKRPGILPPNVCPRNTFF